LNYREFVDRVAARADLDRGQAEAASQVVLAALGERLSEKEATDLASQLARELKPTLLNVPGHGRPISAGDFVRLVAEREPVTERAARLHAQAVLSTVREAVDRGELADILAELWGDPEYDELWAEPSPPAGARTGNERRAEAGARMTYDDFLSAVERRVGLDQRLLEPVVQATLTTLAERITRGEAEDLAAELPPELRPWLEHTGEEAERFSAREFLRRVAHRAPGLDRAEIENAVSAVLVTLREAVSGKEVRDLFSQLPDEMLRLLSSAVSRPAG
jgi:uncharacterized protein (DUF2267 family)